MRKSKLLAVGIGVGLSFMVGFSGDLAFAEGGSGGGEEVEVVVKETNMNGGVEISQLNEGKNTITVMFTGTSRVESPEYIVSKYHLFWGDVADTELAGKLTDETGVTTIIRGEDGEQIFYRSHMQVEFTPRDGVRLVDNSSKVISYVVELKPLKAGYSKKIVAGRYDYSSCVNAVGYVLDGSIFCGRSEWVGGKSYYFAYNQDWQKLEPSPMVVTEVKEVEKVVYRDREATLAMNREEQGKSKGVDLVEVDLGAYRGGIYAADSAGNTKEDFSGDEKAGDREGENRGRDVTNRDEVKSQEEEISTDEVRVPILGGEEEKLSFWWWLGFCIILAVGALGAFSYFFFPISSKRKRDEE